MRWSVAAWHVWQFLLFLSVDVVALAFVRQGDSGAVVVVKTGALGDYILFRNYLRALRAHPSYRGRKIVLCGNLLVREIAEALDRESVDAFLWVDLRAFSSRPLARFRALRQLKRIGASAVLNPVRLRTLIESDALARAASGGTAECIGCSMPPSEKSWSEKTGWIQWNPSWHQAVARRFYTRLLPYPAPLFEFEWNRVFFQGVLGETPLPASPSLNPVGGFASPAPGPFAVLLPGAGEQIKEWPPENYGLLARHLHAAHRLQIVVAGIGADADKAQEIAASSGVPILDLTGTLTQSQLVALIGQAELVVANDSGGIHVAAALGKKGVGIASSIGLVHFHPYPSSLCATVRFVYPRTIREKDRVPASEVAFDAVREAVDDILLTD